MARPNFTLKVMRGATEYTYSEELLQYGYRIEQREQNGLIELSSIQIGIDTAGFAGYTSTLNIAPSAEGMRAALVEATESPEGGEIVWLDGIINPQDITVNPVMERWSVTLVGSATEAFLNRMEEMDFVSGTAWAVITEVLQKRPTSRAQGLAVKEYVSEALVWHDLETALKSTVAAEGSITLEWADPDRDGFMLDVDYGTGTTYSGKLPLAVCDPFARDEDASPDDRPRWTGRALWDVCRALGGWRLACRYDAYPATSITARIITDRNTAAAGGIDLAGLLDDAYAGFELSQAAPDEKDFGVQYKSRVGEDPLLTLTQRPDDYAIYAARHFKLDGDGRGLNEGLKEIPVFLAHHHENLTFIDQTPDPAGHPAYSERVYFSNNPVIEEGRVWLCEIEPVSGVQVVRHEPDNPAVTQLSRTGAAYANNIFRQYGMVRAPAHTLLGSYNLASLTRLPAVGDPTDAVLCIGLAWVVRGLTADLIRQGVEFDLRLYVEAEGLPFEVPAVGPPQNFMAVRNVLIESPEEEWETNLSWDAPLLGVNQGTADDYELQRRFVRYPGGSVLTEWRALTTTASTTYTDPNHVGPYRNEYRLRARNAFGVSNWVYATDA